MIDYIRKKLTTYDEYFSLQLCIFVTLFLTLKKFVPRNVLIFWNCFLFPEIFLGTFLDTIWIAFMWVLCWCSIFFNCRNVPQNSTPEYTLGLSKFLYIHIFWKCTIFLHFCWILLGKTIFILLLVFAYLLFTLFVEIKILLTYNFANIYKIIHTIAIVRLG